MVALKTAVEKIIDMNDEEIERIPSQLDTSEKMLEKFPPKGPLADPPRKGPTAKKNKEKPDLNELMPNCSGILIRTANSHFGLYYSVSDEKLYVSSRVDHRGSGHIQYGERFDEETREWVYTVVYRYDDDREDREIGLRDTTISTYTNNANFKRLQLGSVFDSLEKETFKVDFTRTDIYYDKAKNEFKYGTQLRAVWNAASSNFQLFKNNKEVEMSKDIFYGVTNISKAFEKVFHEDKYKLYLMAYEQLGYIGSELKPNIARALKRLRYLKAVEVVYSAGLPTGISSSVISILKDAFMVKEYKGTSWNPVQDYSIRPSYSKVLKLGNKVVEPNTRWGYDNVFHVNPLGTKLHEVLILPKWFLKDEKMVDEILNHSGSWRGVIQKIQRKTYLGENTDVYREMLTELLEIDAPQNMRWGNGIPRLADEILEAMEDGSVKDYKRLIRYLSFDVKFSQGITDIMDAWNLLRDYYRMCDQMEIKPIRFPSSLKLSHDVASFNHSKMREAISNKVFGQKMEELTDVIELDYSEVVRKADKHNDELKWEIVVPTSPRALIQEGNNLNHCVGSYVDNVSEGKTHIVFLRAFSGEGENEDGKSLLTIELQPHREGEKLAFYISQVRGNSNRLPNEKEEQFLENWCKKRALYRTLSKASEALTNSKKTSNEKWLEAV